MKEIMKTHFRITHAVLHRLVFATETGRILEVLQTTIFAAVAGRARIRRCTVAWNHGVSLNHLYVADRAVRF